MNELTVIRGDTLETEPIIIYFDEIGGEEYILNDTDELKFSCKKKLNDIEPLITKIIPNETKVLRLESQDTKKFDNPSNPNQLIKYYYDIQLTRVDGTVNTIIQASPLYIKPEVD